MNTSRNISANCSSPPIPIRANRGWLQFLVVSFLMACMDMVLTVTGKKTWKKLKKNLPKEFADMFVDDPIKGTL